MTRFRCHIVWPVGWRLTAALLAFAAGGCASRGYVKEQIDPLADRIGRLESRMKELDERVGALEKRPVVTLEDLDRVKDQVTAVGQRAQEALGTAQTAGTRAEAAAQRADAAAGRAEAAAGRATRAFELEQKK